MLSKAYIYAEKNERHMLKRSWMTTHIIIIIIMYAEKNEKHMLKRSWMKTQMMMIIIIIIIIIITINK